MRPLRTFTVTPSLPPAVEALRDIAHDLRWAWNHDAIELFRRLDSDLWEESGHNPVRMLGSISQQRLESEGADPAFLAHLERVAAEFADYDTGMSTWFSRVHGDVDGPLAAYFSAEFGITECLSIFAGGLGILAGDHLKSASDLGVPLIGVGLLYQQGYFRQRLNESGWQQEVYEENDFHNLPVAQVRNEQGEPITVEVPFPGGPVYAKVWKCRVGRVPLYLLDTNTSRNAPGDRQITFQLYGGDHEMRLRQEMVLGIGGFRALEALGIGPAVYHMNEGHSAFLVLEWISRLMERDGLTFAEAREASAGLVFTTHTPVEAGHDYFRPELMRKYLGSYAHRFGIPLHDFIALGRSRPGDGDERFCPTVLALRSSAHANGVSLLHGRVAREMWTGLWPDLPVAEMPITSITNGVHFESWVSLEMKQLYDRYLGPRWREEPAEPSVWERSQRIPPEELWRTRQRRRDRLVAFTRRRLRTQLERRGAPQSEVEQADVVLDPHALTIGFARRFATYKRGTLLLSNPDRLAAILSDRERPVQVIYAGKAHPADDAGKDLIRQIVALTRRENIRHRLVFIDDYDMAVTRYLVQGADVWLNTPVRPLEASGTSGMKAAANGVLNLSTLDGWWDEAYTPEVGWAIGSGEIYRDGVYRDRFESDALYDLVERDLVPTFYDRGADGLPRGWIGMMQTSISQLNHGYNTHRMVREYTERFYLPAAARARELNADDARRARGLAAWKARVAAGWPGVRVVSVDTRSTTSDLRVGQEFEVRASVDLGDLLPDDVTVELCLGRVDSQGELLDFDVSPMQESAAADGHHVYAVDAARYDRSGKQGFTIRVVPHHDDLASPLPGCVTWA